MEPNIYSQAKDSQQAKDIFTKILINNRKNLKILKKKSDGRPNQAEVYTADWELEEK